MKGLFQTTTGKVKAGKLLLGLTVPIVHFMLCGCGTEKIDTSDTGLDTNPFDELIEVPVDRVDRMEFLPDSLEGTDTAAETPQEPVHDGPQPCTFDYDCDNGIFCDGEEKCIEGTCAPAETTRCDDGIDCTIDHCSEEEKKCTYEVNNEMCDDGNYCNGEERCSVLMGCTEGIPPDCSDDDPCTTDMCDEENDTCINIPKDEDGDGYVDISCGGDDCADGDPERNPGIEEVCDDGIDNDCDYMIDMGDPDCLEHLCDSAEEINITFVDGFFSWSDSGSTAGEANNFEASCAGSARSPDIPYRMNVPSRAVVTIEIPTADYDTALHIRTVCGDPASEIHCNDDGGSGLLSRISATFGAGTYIVIVDGYSSSNSGGYTLTVTATPSP